ncbi:site-specific DNA-methyltransferase [Kribbella sp. NBC_00359]|uniref:site-specific DNA-methyltransferase n=1 Tax=Kribbella sp. NBC_00359 TaxID=2975966 RepID=UPI002E1BEB5D
MSTLSNLLRVLEQKDPQLGADLAKEVKALSERRSFGLNFERHTPETVELPGRPIRRGDKVRFLAAPGESPDDVDRRLWKVTAVRRNEGGRIAALRGQTSPGTEADTAERAVEDLVVVAEFRDPIYPGLVSTGKVERGGDKPFHTVINAENFHALQALLYTHEGKIDAIYIDPPYNTGARDWKYNNNYVADDDIYRHSKWLAFMERRLKLAKRLLNPADSVLIATIDEKEYLRLGLLLEQTFSDARIQMVSTVINRKGVARGRELARVNEFVFVVFVGRAGVLPIKSETLGLSVGIKSERLPDIWNPLMRRGTDSKRTDREGGFYPILIDEASGTIHSVGRPLGAGVDRQTIKPPSGTTATWPMRRDGSEGRWQVGPERLEELIADGYAKLGTKNRATGMWTVNYLIAKDINRLATGELVSSGRDASGAHILRYADMDSRERVPKTVWNIGSHDATEHGSNLLRVLLPGRKFPFPKSLYAVEDALRFFVADKKQATIVDFFSGSGTTAHAVMRLNKQDGGRRRCISVTNNEVSADEQTRLRAKGLRPGDPEWESLGICDYITKPRIKAAITGETPAGEPIKGDYKFVDEFPMAEGFEENVEFFTMTYEAPRSVAHNRSFEAVAALLWLKAGAEGRRIAKATDTFEVADVYGVLFDMDASHDFLAAVAEAESVRVAFIVTDDDRSYQMVCSELPAHLEPVRLYESYLTNFTINTGRE